MIRGLCFRTKTSPPSGRPDREERHRRLSAASIVGDTDATCPCATNRPMSPNTESRGSVEEGGSVKRNRIPMMSLRLSSPLAPACAGWGCLASKFYFRMLGTNGFNFSLYIVGHFIHDGLPPPVLRWLHRPRSPPLGHSPAQWRGERRKQTSTFEARRYAGILSQFEWRPVVSHPGLHGRKSPCASPGEPFLRRTRNTHARRRFFSTSVRSARSGRRC